MRFLRSKTSDGYGSYYSKRGDHATKRVAEAIARKSWRWTLLNLAWTAGPVTIAAIFIGHKMGFGDSPSTSQIIYFAFYTLVVGLSAVIATILREALYEPRIKQQQELLLKSIDHCYSLILHIRDLDLHALPEKERKIMVAFYTLQSAGSTPEAVRSAVADLTNNSDLVSAVERIIAYDDMGMQSLAKEVLEKHKAELEHVQEDLAHIAPITFELLLRWMQGNSPDYSDGRPRDQGFIQRTLDAVDEDDPNYMTLSDAYEVASLAFEFLNGREISVLQLRFFGSQSILKEKKKLDVATRRYRRAVRARNNAIRLLLDHIDTDGLLDRLTEYSLPASALVSTLVEKLQDLPKEEVQAHQKDYEDIYFLHQAVINERKILVQQKQKYLQTVRKRGEKLSLTLDQGDLSRAGFYIEQGMITLEDDQKLALARKLEKVIGERIRQLSSNRAKHVAMEVVSELDSLIDLNQIERQAAIESSNALQIGYLKRNLTAATKAGHVKRVLQSMHENQMLAAHRLARNLVTYYGVHLSDAVIQLLVVNFGAEEAYLRSLRDPELAAIRAEAQLLPEPQKMPAWKEIVAGG